MSYFKHILQDINTSTNNYTTDNILSGGTWSGTSEETFGINGIQIFHSADRECRVYLDQSVTTDFTSELTVTDHFDCLSNVPVTRTFVSVAPYFRLRVKNIDTIDTTELITAAGMTPIINPLPRSLTDDGRLMTETTITGRENTERHAWINPTNEQAVSPVYRIVGTNFDGIIKDTNFWIDGSLLDGSVTQAGGEIDLHTNATGATAASSAKYTSVRKSRFVAGSAQLFDGGFNFKTTFTANNIRRVGAYTTTDVVNTPVDGFYFELSGSTFSVNSIANSGTPVSVISGSFNGSYGRNWIPTPDTYYKMSIEWSPLGASYYVNSKLLHKLPGAHQSHYMTLPITIENLNITGSVDVSFETVGMYIARQGELHTNPTSNYLLTGTKVLKYGAGVLKRIIVSDNIGRVIIYDSVTASGTVITNLDTAQGSQPLGQVDFDIPFNDGLTIDITGNVGVTTVYE